MSIRARFASARPSDALAWIGPYVCSGMAVVGVRLIDTAWGEEMAALAVSAIAIAFVGAPVLSAAAWSLFGGRTWQSIMVYYCLTGLILAGIVVPSSFGQDSGDGSREMARFTASQVAVLGSVTGAWGAFGLFVARRAARLPRSADTTPARSDFSV